MLWLHRTTLTSLDVFMLPWHFSKLSAVSSWPKERNKSATCAPVSVKQLRGAKKTTLIYPYYIPLSYLNSAGWFIGIHINKYSNIPCSWSLYNPPKDVPQKTATVFGQYSNHFVMLLKHPHASIHNTDRRFGGHPFLHVIIGHSSKPALQLQHHTALGHGWDDASVEPLRLRVLLPLQCLLSAWSAVKLLFSWENPHPFSTTLKMFSLSASIAACASTCQVVLASEPSSTPWPQESTWLQLVACCSLVSAKVRHWSSKKITSLNPISKLQKSHRLQIVCWHIFLSKLLKSRTIINSLCKAFCLVTGRRIARHKMTNIYFEWFHLRLYSRPTKIGVNQELHLRVVPVSAGTKTTGYLTLQDPKPLQEAWQCPTCLPQHWKEEIPWTSELLFSGLRLVVMVYALAWELRGRLLRSIHWVEVGYACLHGKQVPIPQRWWKNKFRKECLKLKKAWLNALGLAFLFGIVQYRESCDKHHGRRCQFTRNTKPRFASFVSIFPRIPLRNTPAARHASQKHTRPAGNISVHAMGPLKQSHGLGIKQLIDAGHL